MRLLYTFAPSFSSLLRPAAAVLVLLAAAGSASASYILEVHDPIGPDPFTRYVYVCGACTPEQHAAVTPPAGTQLQRAALATYDSASVVRPTIAGVDPGFDLVPEIPGDDFLLTAEVVGGTIVEFALPNVFTLAQVARQTVMTFDAGTVLHEVHDPDGHDYFLFAFDLLLEGTIDPTVEGALAGTPLPTGWSYSSRTLSEALVVDSGGVATVFGQNFGGIANSWQRYALPEPQAWALLALGLAMALRARRPTR